MYYDAKNNEMDYLLSSLSPRVVSICYSVMKLNPHQAPFYGECLLTVQLCDGECSEDQKDAEFYLLFSGTRQRHLTSTQRIDHVTLQAVCPAHDCCEAVRVILCSIKPGGGPVELVAEDDFHYVQDLASTMAELLVGTAGQAASLECAAFLDECRLPPLKCEQLDKNLALALRHLTSPQGWSVFNPRNCAEPASQENFLHLAARPGLRQAAVLLLQQPGDREALRLPNKQGLTPLHLAENRGLCQLQQLCSQEETLLEASRQILPGRRVLQHHPGLYTYTLTVGSSPRFPPSTLQKDVEELRRLIRFHKDGTVEGPVPGDGPSEASLSCCSSTQKTASMEPASCTQLSGAEDRSWSSEEAPQPTGGASWRNATLYDSFCRIYSLEGLTADWNGRKEQGASTWDPHHPSRMESEERGSLVSLTEEEQSDLGECSSLDCQVEGSVPGDGPSEASLSCSSTQKTASMEPASCTQLSGAEDRSWSSEEAPQPTGGASWRNATLYDSFCRIYSLEGLTADWNGRKEQGASTWDPHHPSRMESEERGSLVSLTEEEQSDLGECSSLDCQNWGVLQPVRHSCPTVPLTKSVSMLAISQKDLHGREMTDSQLMGEFETDAKELEADSWNFTVGKKYLEQLEKDTIKRQSVIYELIKTEMNHVRVLKIMSDVYTKGLLKEVQLEVQTVERVFPMLDELLDIHTLLLTRILVRKRESKQEGKDGDFIIRNIGGVLISQFSGPDAERMKKVYGRFFSRHNDAAKIYKELENKNKRFQAFIKKQMSSPIVRRLSIPECILLATQRITKYPLLLQRILQYTKEGEDDHKNLTQALQLMKEVIAAVDRKVSEHQKKERLKEAHSRMDSKSIMHMQMFAKEDLVRGRRLLHDGPLQLKNFAGRLKDVQAFLLSDVLVFLQEKRHKYVFASLDQRSTVISLEKLIVREVANEERGLFLISAGILRPELFEVLASSKEERNTWMQLIQDAMHSMDKDEDEGITSQTVEDKGLQEKKAKMRDLLRKPASQPSSWSISLIRQEKQRQGVANLVDMTAPLRKQLEETLRRQRELEVERHLLQDEYQRDLERLRDTQRELLSVISPPEETAA